ncbi:MAG: autoinducer binding domain-containing protein [Spongiibacteraceae bacterium]|nr:autoinducer binding domain-containing protein [Spongiibacteraceae bacterium]
MYYSDLIKKCDKLKDLSTIKQYTEQGVSFVTELGFSAFAYTAMPALKVPKPKSEFPNTSPPTLIGNYHPDWIVHFNNKQYYVDDYIYSNIHQLERKAHICSLNSLKGKLTHTQKKIYHEARRINLGYDRHLSIPISSLIGVNSLFTCSFLGNENDFNKLCKRNIPFLEFYASSYSKSILEKFKKNLLGVRVPQLSIREQDVLAFCANGLNQAQIGDKMGINTSTVKTHIKNSRVKLQAENTIHACSMAVNLGIIT